ncbi:hypothetical protein [Okibacterium fritillariae]|uniref:Uncharacterized protein n=1 Tax=Okibacterium fritillariae TaxID=123320 RepID=A0A1T5L1A7_9MICO|nr:hypothetical protein [Okibacterium fritillariae]SKC69495.1 hypothetical protein SAMN06309945_2820 [Okibacterium fritillariae]
MSKDTEVALQHARSIQAKVLRSLGGSTNTRSGRFLNAPGEPRHARSARMHSERYELASAR